jgi:hypothetical protein
MKIEAMLWIVVLLLIAVSILFPKTRSLSFSAIGVAIIAIVAIIVVAKRGEPSPVATAVTPIVRQKPVDYEKFLLEKLDKADPDAKNRIPLQDIRFDQIRAEDGALRGTIGTVVARLYNKSASYTLTDYGYYLVIQDCIKTVCTTVFDRHGLSAITVPPDQARDVKISVQDALSGDVPPIKILGVANILITPTATRAKPDEKASAD